MRKALFALTALLATVPARAPADAWQPMEDQSRGGSRITAGVRSGYAWGLGDVDGSASMKDVVGFQVPIQLDLGYRFLPDLSVGVYGSYGFSKPTGGTKDTCDYLRLDCSARAIRAGFQMNKYWTARRGGGSGVWNDPRSRDDVSSWLGWGLGYDSITVKMEGPAGSADITASGVEWFVQGGIDFYSAPGAAMGLFASFSLARFTQIDSPDGSGSIDQTKLHEWLTIGLRGEFGGP